MKRVLTALFAVPILFLTACHVDFDYDAVVSRGSGLPKSSSSQAESNGSSSQEQSASSIISSQLVNTSSALSESTVSNPSSSKAPVVSAPIVSELEKPVQSNPSSLTPPSTVTSDPPAKPKVVSVTIPEGYSFMEIAATLQAKGVCSKADFYKAAQSYQVKSFAIPTSSNRAFKLEGYLFPDTYEFYLNDDPVNVIRKMLNNYAAKSGMPSDQTLILASIIEKEARSDAEMAKVSSVFHNRLKAGMRLQADPTRDYVNKFITGNSLVANQGKYASLYNTYKCSALPAGPICSPSLRAIKAAQNPANTDYLYFFFSKGVNYYSTTLEEHEQKMKEYGVGD